MNTLPVDSIIPALKEALRTRSSAVLVAAPGAGKTTRVPLALLDEPWLAGRRILMLEPRRLAARAAARYMAASLGEQVGDTVGYRVRLDTRVGPATRIEVVTEGVLTRMLQADPALEDTGLVIFDEFHERSLHADLGLALCLEAQSVLRDDLRILVMSATLDAEPVAALLGDAPVLTSEGRAYPVETRYLDRRVEGAIERSSSAGFRKRSRRNREISWSFCRERERFAGWKKGSPSWSWAPPSGWPPSTEICRRRYRTGRLLRGGRVSAKLSSPLPSPRPA